MKRVPCRTCAATRRVLPSSLRKRLENLERKLQDKKEKSGESRKA